MSSVGLCTAHKLCGVWLGVDGCMVVGVGELLEEYVRMYDCGMSSVVYWSTIVTLRQFRSGGRGADDVVIDSQNTAAKKSGIRQEV